MRLTKRKVLTSLIISVVMAGTGVAINHFSHEEISKFNLVLNLLFGFIIGWTSEVAREKRKKSK